MALIAGVQFLIASLRQNDLETEVREIVLRVGANNHDDIKRQAVEAARKTKAEMVPSDVTIQYAPTDRKSYAQSVVGKLATFDNHWATITAEYRQPILVFRVKRRLEVNRLIEGTATQRAPREIPEP